MLGLLAGLLALILVVVSFIALVAKVRSSKGGSSHRRWLVGTVVLGIVVAGAVAAAVISAVSEQRAISRPIPSFPSLTSSPDNSLEGKVAFVAEKKDVKAETFDACAIAAGASGAQRSELACWPFDPAVPVTVRWTSPTTVEITAWERTGKESPSPVWSKVASLDGTVVEQPASSAIAPTDAGLTPPGGTSLEVNDADGSASITMTSPEGTRKLLDVKDAQLWWHLLGVPAWSPAGSWVATLDSSGRLLITSTAAKPSTKVLATGVIGLPDEVGMPALAVQPY